MKSPDPLVERRLTREEMETSFVPCCYCGRVERLVNGVYKIAHDYSKHPGLDRQPNKRMTTEELVDIPNPDFTEVLTRIYGKAW